MSFAGKIGRANALTESERSVILPFFDENKSEREIAERIGRSKTAVHIVVVASRTNETRHRPGRPHLVTQTANAGNDQARFDGYVQRQTASRHV